MVDRSSLPSTRSAPRPPLPTRGQRSSRRLPVWLTSLATVVLLASLLAACGQGNQNLPPAAPASVNANPIAGGVRVVWLDQSTNETEFIVYRADADDEAENTELAEVARVPTDGAMFEDFGVDMGLSYRYAIAATNTAGTSDLVLQEPDEPVSPGVGVRLTVSLVGSGQVSVDNSGKTVACSSECVLGLAKGSSVTLTAEGADGVAFAGWAGACGGGGACTFTIDDDADVEARFSKHVLLVVASGDSPVDIAVFPVDEFGVSECTLAAGRSCAFGFDSDAALKASINGTLVEPEATFRGYGGACTAPQGRYCLVDVDGETVVDVEVVRVPVAAAQAYQGLEDVILQVAAADGLLKGVSDSPGDTHTAVVVTPPTSGTLSVAADGSFEYQSAPDANGTVTFEFVARDAHANESAPVTATLSIQAVNDAPRFQLAGNPPATLGNGVQVTIPDFATALHRGGGADESSQTLAFTIVRTSGPADLLSAGPTLTISGTTATLSYTPAIGKVGSATFQANLKDSGGSANGGMDTSEPLSFTVTSSPLTLTLTATTGGALSPVAGTYEYGYGTNVNVVVTPATDYQFAGWTGACTGFSNPCVVSMTSNKSLNASFSPYVRVRPTNGFYFVNSSPAGIADCTSFFGVCDYAFPAGTVLTLGFSENRTVSGVVCTQSNPTNACTFTVTGPVTVTIE